jgi:hypothetical protein
MTMQRMTTMVMMLAAAVTMAGCSPAPLQPQFSTQAGLLKFDKDSNDKVRSSLDGREFGQCVAEDSRAQRGKDAQGTGFGEIHRTDCQPAPSPSPIQYYM